MKSQDLTDDYFMHLLEIAHGDKTHWDKKQKNYVDENGISQTLISYNDLLLIVKRSVMAGTLLETERFALGLIDSPYKFKLLKHQQDDGTTFAGIIKKK